MVVGIPILSEQRASAAPGTRFGDQVDQLFRAQHVRLFRYLDRLSGEPDLAADIAQEVFVKLFARGSMPDNPEAWLITVAMNLYRNHVSNASRRATLLSARSADLNSVGGDVAAQSASAGEEVYPRRVRAALDAIPVRERTMLLLRAEGYSYRDIAAAANVDEASVGTLLARAKRAFREAFEG